MHVDQSVRQWCRVFATPERSLQTSSGAQKMFVQFFVQYPVTVRMHACTDDTDLPLAALARSRLAIAAIRAVAGAGVAGVLKSSCSTAFWRACKTLRAHCPKAAL